MEATERRLGKAEESIELLFGKFNSLNAQQIRTETTLEHLLVAIGELKGAIEGIKAKPGDRWDKVVYAVISALVAAVIAYFIKGG